MENQLKFFKDVQTIFVELLGNFEEKAKSPFAGTFIFFFIVYNWKPFYYFFESDEKPLAKIAYLSKNYPWDNTQNLLYPLYFAVLSLLAFTVISGLTTLVWGILKDWLDKLNLKFIEKATFLTKKEEKILREEMRNQARLHNEQVNSLEEKILTLQRANKAILIEDKDAEGQEVDSEDEVAEEYNVTPEIDDTFAIKEKMENDAIEKFTTEYIQSAVSKVFDKKEGRLWVHKFLGEVTNCDMDDNYQEAELTRYNYIISSAAKNYPNLFTVPDKSVSVSTLEGKTTSIDGRMVRSYADKLVRWGLLEKSEPLNKQSYVASGKLLAELIQMSKKL